MNSKILFDVPTPCGFKVHTTYNYWNLIIAIKHPIMRGRELDIKDTLQSPDEIRRSRIDPEIYLFYKLESLDRFLCAVIKKETIEGFLVTAYLTNKIKEGEKVWSK